MGNSRRETLKKSLGLSEYPWSSDDDDNPQITQITPASVSTTSRSQADTTHPNVPETSAQANATQSPYRRRHSAKFESELFWSLLSNNLPRTCASGPSAGPSRASSSSVEPTESTDLTSPMTNLQRIFAIKKLRPVASSSRHCAHPVARSTKSNVQRMQSNLHEQHKGVRGKTSQRQGGFYLHPQPGSPTRSPRRTPPRSPLRSPVPAPPSDSAPSDDDFEPTSRLPTAAANPTDNNMEEPEQNDREVESRVDGRPLQPGRESPRVPQEVEVVDLAMETDGAEGEQQPDDNVSNQAQASGDDDGNEENAEGAETAALRVTKRKREASVEVQAIAVQDLNRSLLQLLECPVCLEWMEPPMSQCRRGHLVCVRCRARLSACPVCRTTFSSVRNRAMEGVAEMLRYPCRHGCGRETQLRQRGSHEANCASRRYRCPTAACAKREPLPLGALVHHFQTAHQAMLKVGFRHEFSMKVNVDQHDDWLVAAGCDLFHLRVDVNVRTWGVLVHVAYIGPKCKANGFTYEVSVVGLHSERKLVYTRETHSDLESVSLNVSRQDCFHLSLDQALNFLRYKNRHCEPDKFLDFSVAISAREPSAPADRPDLDS
ncbi:uncharacterized protein LOC123867170 isoform X2 [Maniola jurtina]|uniref:uncharacterized protein LOC123867170 isoform X2 n=1 Tax=Maniola jurtina TaxID=191418 RepID=UPI001E686187|nr:uncharacterized protein LOC123867170 isoform X2 [Maniola jurtina]